MNHGASFSEHLLFYPYIGLVLFFVLWTIKKVLLTILGIFVILFRKIF